jgi:hypothetical protein
MTAGDASRAVALSRELYLGVLGREPDPLGQADMCEQLEHLGEECLHLILERMLGSDEFHARWSSQHGPNAALGREGAGDALILDFSAPEAGRYLAEGWHAPEPSWTWAAGDRSLIWLPRPVWSDDATLFLEFNAAQRPGARGAQRLVVVVNGEEVGRVTIHHERPTTLVCHVPRSVIDAKAAVALSLHHPDAFVSADLSSASDDPRELSFAFREVRLERCDAELQAIRAAICRGLIQPLASMTGPADVSTESLFATAAGFESLGSNCELGFVQRDLGIEPLSLLRFAGIPLHKLWRGLETGFAGLAVPEHFHLRPRGDGGEYIGRDDVYLLEYHTGQAAVVPERLHASEPARLRYLARKLLDDMEDATKILVVKADDSLDPAQIATLLRMVHRRGPAILLWVEAASPDHPPGTVDAICPGLLKGYVDRFADLTQGTHTISHWYWRDVLVHAAAMREQVALKNTTTVR